VSWCSPRPRIYDLPLSNIVRRHKYQVIRSVVDVLPKLRNVTALRYAQAIGRLHCNVNSKLQRDCERFEDQVLVYHEVFSERSRNLYDDWINFDCGDSSED
jgi:hypothetical protein